MTGRPLCSEEEAIHRGFGGAECARRRQILRETIAAFETGHAMDHYRRLAEQNLERWRAKCTLPQSMLRVDVRPGDWGEVAYTMTRTYGVCFAVLNMANAYVPDGAYIEGAVAQEENMFRRTDCHFRIGEDEYSQGLDRYHPEMKRMLSAQDGMVYLDVRHPRFCIRGAEERTRTDLGYPWLSDEQIFPFFELRTSAQDLRDGSDFDPHDARRRVSAQLDTLRDHQVRHVVLGAFGCGAFRNPAPRVAQIYREEITTRAVDFSVVAFAIFSAGYGPDNYRPFAEAFHRE